MYDEWWRLTDASARARTRVADVAGNNNLTRTKSQYHRTHPGRLVNFSSFRVSNRHQQHPQQQQPQQQQNTCDDGARGGASAAVARAVAAGGSRLLSASAFGNTLQQHRQLQQQKRDAASQQLQLQCDGGTSAGARADSRKNRRKSAAAVAAGTSLRYCKSVSPIAEKPPARQSPPRSASMNLQPRNFAVADSCLRWWWPAAGGCGVARWSEWHY